jgi:excisionase family DNA binding protein
MVSHANDHATHDGATMDDLTPEQPQPDQTSTSPLVERIAYTVAEVATALGISRSHCYDLVRRSLLPSIVLGGRTLIPRAALLCHIHRLTCHAHDAASDTGCPASELPSAGAATTTVGQTDPRSGPRSCTCHCAAQIRTWATKQHCY